MIVSPLRLTLVGALLGLHLGAQAAPAAPATVSFDTTPRAGQDQRQQIDMKAVMKTRIEAGPAATDEQRAQIAQAAERVAQMGPVKMAMQMQQTMKVGQPDAQGWLPLTVATGSNGGQVEVGGKTMPLPNNKSQNVGFTARFNPQDFGFEIQSVEGTPELNDFIRNQGNAMVGEALQLFKALSQRPLKVGDSVEVPLTMALPVPLPGGAGAMQSKLRYTLARVEHGVAYFDLGMELTMDITTPLPAPAAASAPEGEAASAPAAAPRTVNVVVSGSGKGSSSLRLADRLPLTNQLSMAMKMTMNMPDNGLMFMDMDMDMKSKGESLSKPAAPATKKP